MIDIDSKRLDVNSLYPYPYRVINNGLHVESVKNKVTSVRKLCNFLPYITSEISVDDGVEINRFISIAGVHENGSNLKEIKIPSSELAGSSMSWIIENWGAKCNIEPGRNIKDNIRHAIQSTAKNVPSKTIYKHFGWKLINNKWEFLMNGKELNIEAEGKLEHYWLYSKDPEVSVEASLDFIKSKFAPDYITYPLLAYTYLTPLNHFLKEAGCEPKTVMCLIGKTGTKKSTLSALTLSHFGDFTNVDLPLSFRDTANSIISSTFILKDILTVIDDYHPSTRSEELNMMTTAQTIMRAYGDRVGRGRLKSDSSLLVAKPPRGNAIITGEQSPDITESTTVRTVQLELKPNDIDLKKLSDLQSKARQGLLASSMKHYIHYIKDTKINNIAKAKIYANNLRENFNRMREYYASRFCENNIEFHPRLPETASWLYIGLSHYLDFFKAMGKLTNSEYQIHLALGIEIFYEIILKQITSTFIEKPSIKFICKLQSLLASGKAITLSKDSPSPTIKPLGFIGYEDDEYYYLISDITHSMVKKLCSEQEESFPVGIKSLLKHLYEDGYIDGSESSKTKVVRIGNSTRRMMVLRKDRVVISSEEP